MKWLKAELEDLLPIVLVLAGAFSFIAFMEGWWTALAFAAVTTAVYGVAYGIAGVIWLVAGIAEAVFVRRHIRSLTHPFIRSEPSDNPYQSPGAF